MANRDEVTIEPLRASHVSVCEGIANALPEWFGIECGLREMRAAMRTDAGLIAVAGGEVVGFVTFKPSFPETWEITWLAVAPAWHREGIGRRLIDVVRTCSHQAGASLLMVKTLAEQHPSPAYAQTRAFYDAVGFHRLAVIPEIWGPANPCLLLVRPVA